MVTGRDLRLFAGRGLRRNASPMSRGDLDRTLHRRHSTTLQQLQLGQGLRGATIASPHRNGPHFRVNSS